MVKTRCLGRGINAIAGKDRLDIDLLTHAVADPAERQHGNNKLHNPKRKGNNCTLEVGKISCSVVWKRLDACVVTRKFIWNQVCHGELECIVEA